MTKDKQADKEARGLAFLRSCGLKRYAIHTRPIYGNGMAGPWSQMGSTDHIDEARKLAATTPWRAYIDDLALGTTEVVDGAVSR